MGEYIPSSLPRSQVGPPRRTRVVDALLERIAEGSSAVQDSPRRAMVGAAEGFDRGLDRADEALSGEAQSPGSASQFTIRNPVAEKAAISGNRDAYDLGGNGVRQPANTVEEIVRRMPSVPLTDRQALGPTSATAIAPAQGAMVPAAQTSQERFPGLRGAMPDRFTPEQTEQTRASLERNAGPHIITAAEITGQTPTRADSAWERGSLDRQMAGTAAVDATREAGQGIEVAGLLRAKQISDARARMGFEATYKVPYDKEMALYVSEAERKMAMDDDYDALHDAIDAKHIQGLFMDPEDYKNWSRLTPEQQAMAKARGDRNYQKAKLEAAVHWGVRRGGVDINAKAFSPQQDISGLSDQ